MLIIAIEVPPPPKTGPVFLRARDFPVEVSWNELFSLAMGAALFSEKLDSANKDRVHSQRKPLYRTHREHNTVVRGINDTIRHPSFKQWAEAQEMYEGDLPLVPYATHPSFYALGAA